MKERMIMWAVEMFITKLTADDLKKWVEVGLDLMEDKAAETTNKVDDMLVGAFASMLRSAMDMEDNDDLEVEVKVQEVEK